MTSILSQKSCSFRAVAVMRAMKKLTAVLTEYSGMRRIIIILIFISFYIIKIIIFYFIFLDVLQTFSYFFLLYLFPHILSHIYLHFFLFSALDLFRNIEMPLLISVADAEFSGFPISLDFFSKLKRDLNDRMR